MHRPMQQPFGVNLTSGFDRNNLIIFVNHIK
jgi:hypothetical protein